MKKQTQKSLLTLNREFYERTAPHFDATRRGWTPGLCAILPHLKALGKEYPSILDVGCGNGRFARLLAKEGFTARYTGVDGNQTLLQLGRNDTRCLTEIDCRFVKADLADPGWIDMLTVGCGAMDCVAMADSEKPDLPQYDLVLCTATMQHLPGYSMRLRLLRDLSRLANGLVILSFWQFLSSRRFRLKLIEPHEVGVEPSDLEPNDAFLPWRQGVEAVRYVHQIDEAELRELAADSELSVVRTFRADGKEADLNLYAVLAHTID